MIPVNEPLLDGNEKKYLAECVDTGWISSEGPFVTRFEQMFAEFCERKHAVAVSNGTASLEVALYAAGIRPGQRVIMPSFTIASCAVAAIRLGATPYLVDMDPQLWCMDVNQACRMVERGDEHTAAVMPVHIYGHPVDMDPLLKICDKYRVKIIEDAAEVHGAQYHSAYLAKSAGEKVWRPCGSFGEVSSFSFYANKIITTGEGGMVVTDNEEMAERARSYRNLCFGKEERFRHEDIGYNFRMTNLQAAVGVAQMEQADKFIAKKLQIAKWYAEELAGVEELRLQPIREWAKPVHWMIAVQLESKLGLTAEQAMQKLREHKIGTRPFFMGLHAQPSLRYLVEVPDGGCPYTDNAYKYGFYLPSGMTLEQEQIKEVCNRLKDIIADAR